MIFYKLILTLLCGSLYNGQCQEQHHDDEEPQGTISQPWCPIWCQGATSILLPTHDKHLHWTHHLIPHFCPTWPRALQHSGEQTYEQALTCNPIAVACVAIHAIWVSGAHWEVFVAVIRDGNKDSHLKDPLTSNTIVLRLLQLLWDVPTQWDSVYYMICWFC